VSGLFFFFFYVFWFFFPLTTPGRMFFRSPAFLNLDLRRYSTRFCVSGSFFGPPLRGSVCLPLTESVFVEKDQFLIIPLWDWIPPPRRVVVMVLAKSFFFFRTFPKTFQAIGMIPFLFDSFPRFFEVPPPQPTGTPCVFSGFSPSAKTVNLIL